MWDTCQVHICCLNLNVWLNIKMRIDNFLKDNIIVLVCVELHCIVYGWNVYIVSEVWNILFYNIQ